MKFNREKTILILILFLAACLRFWQLGQVPASPDWDEAALGYNAYSIMKTGKDEYGAVLPLILRSFDDYKPAVFVYLVVPAVKFFGLNIFATRFPAALLGTLAVLLTYLLVREIFGSKFPHLPLISAGLLAISPWHLQFSRIAFESNIALFFDILLVWLFFKALKKPWFLILTATLAGLNIYVYQAEKVFTPLLVLALFLIYRQEIFKLPRKYLVMAILTGLLMLAPFFRMTLTTPEIFLRAKGTSISADQTPFLAQTAIKIMRDHQANDSLGLILDNRRVTYALALARGYFSHFDLNWLFVRGGEARHHAPEIGSLYLAELPFFLIGIYSLLFAKMSKKSKLLIFSWFLLAPIPAAFASGSPHEVRTIRFLPMLQIFTGFGLITAWQMINKKKKVLKFSVIGLLGLFFLFNFGYFLDQYFVQQNYFHSQSWQYGYQQAVEEVQKIEGNYRQIVVSNQPHLDQSYMFFLFYLKYDPRAYQQLGGTVSGGFAEARNAFGKYVFRPIDWPSEVRDADVLYVGRPEDFGGDAAVIQTINFLDGQPAIKIVPGQ